MKFKQLYIVLFALIVSTASAQQDVQFSDYKINMSSFNPAFAGFFDGSVLLIHRSQFVGIEGAPESQNLNVNVPLNVNMGMGFNAISEKLGVTEEVILTGDYSYTIFTDDVNMITFGLKAGFNILNVDYTRLDMQDEGDPSFMNNIENKISPRVGVGFLFNTANWYVGVSTPNFLRENVNPTVSSTTVSDKPHFYFTTGYKTALTDELIFKPSILAKAVEEAPLGLDFALNFEYMQKFRFGASYRWDAAVTGIVGANVVPELQVGYAYDHAINGLGKYAPSSHQFYLKYTFKKSNEMRRECSSCSFTDSSNDLGY
jgi:type IX secretion system PorP/SprF family membrane protein